MADSIPPNLPTFANTSPRTQLLALSLLLFLTFLALRTYHSRTQTSKLLPLPPGPSGYPLIGNLPTVLSRAKVGSQHFLFQQWAQTYGPIYKVHIGPFTQYMVNSDVAVKAIFEGKNGAVSANRPTWLVSREHICNDWNVLLLDGDTPRWKQQRRVTTANVGSLAMADRGVPVLEYESLKFLAEVAVEGSVDSQRLWQAVMRYTYSAFTTQMFGLDIPTSENPAIHYIHETGTAQILGTLPGSYLVDVFPVLDKLPLSLKSWEREGRARFARDLAWCREKLHRIESLQDRGDTIPDSLLSKILSDPAHLGFSGKDEGAYFSLMLTIGAADTSQISTWAFLEALLRYPDVQSKAQTELDRVVGSDRVPCWSDYDRVPYMRCLLKETWRWRPPVGLGHPHVTSEEIVYDGMRIPAGSRVHLNGWAIQHDAARHYEPDEFIPERFEEDQTTVMQSINSADVKKRDHFAFGAGRRICPGYNVAERSLGLAVS